MSSNPVEMAFALARTGQFKNFTAVKRALARNFNVDRELQGRQLASDVTRVCREAQRRTPSAE